MQIERGINMIPYGNNMKRYIDYDFSGFIDIIKDLKSNPTNNHMRELKNELNKFFSDSKCLDAIYTNNTDKLFFGMAVMPKLETEEVKKIVLTNDPMRVKSYYLEVDSKLFSPILRLTSREILAILLHEVGHMVNDSTPVDVVRKNLDVYLVKTNQTIKINDSFHYNGILAFGLKDALRKVSSIFEFEDDEIIADSFVVACGFGNELASAFDKIVRNSYNINKDVGNKFIVLSWVLRLYVDVKLRRIVAIKSLRKAKDRTASKLERNEMENVIRRLNRIDDDSLLEGFLDTPKSIANSIIGSFKYNGIRGFEDDLYEYNLRIKNVNTEQEALTILRNINTRMACIDDYVSTEPLSASEQKRWWTLYNKYNKLREDLSKKMTYKDDYSRIHIISSTYDAYANQTGK